MHFKRHVFILCVLVLTLTGCGPKRQVQVIADARAGAQAVLATPLPVSVDDMRKAWTLARALAQNVMAATEHIPDLPATAITPDAILLDVPAYAASASAAVASPPPYDPPAPTTSPVDVVADTLTPIGKVLVSAGTWTLSTCALALVLVLLPWTAAIVRPFLWLIEEAAVLAGAALIIGAGLVWLGAHSWILYLSAGLALIVVALRWRKAWWPAVAAGWAFVRRLTLTHHQP